MSNQEENSQFLWNYLEEIREAIGWTGLAFDFPERKLNTAKKIIAFYDSLDDTVRKDIAERFGLSPDGYKELIARGEELYYDPKYANVSSGERTFYITVDIFFKDIIQAAKELGLEAKDEVIFGLLPVRQTNAVAKKAPDNRGYVIAVNTGTFIFLHFLGIIFSRFFERLTKNTDFDSVEFNDSVLEQMVLKSINEKMNQLFVDLIVSYYYATYYHLGIPGFTVTNYTDIDELDDMSGRGTQFEDLMLEFVLCHEYIHACSPVDRSPADQIEDIQEKVNRSWSEEFGADTLGLYLSIRAKDHRQKPEATPGLNIVTMAKAFLGASCVLSCLEILEKIETLLPTTVSKNSSPQSWPTHPPASYRKDMLKQSIERLLMRLGTPKGASDMVFSPAKSFDVFIHALWETNKNRAKTAILQAKVES